MLFIQQSKSAVQGFLQTIPALDGLCFRPSRLKEIHLSAFAGPNALSIVQATPALFCQRGLEEKEGEDLLLSAVDGYVNLTFPLPLLWKWLEGLAPEDSLPGGWEQESETPDFAAIPYARNRLRMELFALKHGKGCGDETSKEAESLLWPLFALGYWPEEQRMRVLTEGADVLARHLEKRHGHDTRLKSLWTAWALLLADEKDDGSAGDWEKNRQDR